MIKTEEYAQRRHRLMTEAGENTLILIGAARPQLRNGDSFFAYRQDSDFLYLTGLQEPDAVLALVPGRGAGEQILFCRPADPERERWDGPRLGLEGARQRLGMDDAFPIDDLDEILPNLMEGVSRVYHPVGKDADFDQRIIGWRQRLRQLRREKGPGEIVSLEYLLHEQRLVKSRQEIRAMKKAGRISADAIVRAMKFCAPDLNESDIHAELIHEYRRRGCQPAYLPIVAGGKNALILHYIENNHALNDGDLVLIDAGCELDGYAADISRTFPVNGVFSPEQRAVYDVVLDAQRQAIDQVRPGHPYEAYHETAVKVLTTGLCDLGLLKGSVDELIESNAYRRFYMHKTGHWIGLDVHDVGDYRIDNQSRVLEKNMVVTVEPGLYIGAEEDIPKRFRNIGIRVEDDIRVTGADPENLTSSVASTIQDIEEIMAR